MNNERLEALYMCVFSYSHDLTLDGPVARDTPAPATYTPLLPDQSLHISQYSA